MQLSAQPVLPILWCSQSECCFSSYIIFFLYALAGWRNTKKLPNHECRTLYQSTFPSFLPQKEGCESQRFTLILLDVSTGRIRFGGVKGLLIGVRDYTIFCCLTVIAAHTISNLFYIPQQLPSFSNSMIQSLSLKIHQTLSQSRSATHFYVTRSFITNFTAVPHFNIILTSEYQPPH